MGGGAGMMGGGMMHGYGGGEMSEGGYSGGKKNLNDMRYALTFHSVSISN